MHTFAVQIQGILGEIGEGKTIQKLNMGQNRLVYSQDQISFFFACICQNKLHTEPEFTYINYFSLIIWKLEKFFCSLSPGSPEKTAQ